MIGFPLYHCSKKLCLPLLSFYSKSLFVCMTFLAFQTNPQKYYPPKDKTMRLYWPCSQYPIRIILYHVGQRDYVPQKVHFKVTPKGSSASACNKQKLLFSARCLTESLLHIFQLCFCQVMQKVSFGSWLQC